MGLDNTSLPATLHKIDQLFCVFNAQKEIVETICRLYQTWNFTQEQIGRSTLETEMEKSTQVTISVVKKILEANLDESIRVSVERIWRNRNLQHEDSSVQAERWRISGLKKVLPSDDAKSMNGAEQLPLSVLQALVKKYEELSWPDAEVQLSTKEIRPYLSTRLQETFEIARTPRAIQWVLYRQKKKLEKGETRSQLSDELREEIYALWEQSFPKYGNPAMKGSWYSKCAETINQKYNLTWTFSVTAKNVKNVVQWMNQKKKSKQ